MFNAEELKLMNRLVAALETIAAALDPAPGRAESNVAHSLVSIQSSLKSVVQENGIARGCIRVLSGSDLSPTDGSSRWNSARNKVWDLAVPEKVEQALFFRNWA